MRDLRSKKMPAKPSSIASAEEELDLDLPETEEEVGAAEADEDLLADEDTAEVGPLDDIADEDLIAEVQKRGLSLDEPLDEEVSDIEEDAAEDEIV